VDRDEQGSFQVKLDDDLLRYCVAYLVKGSYLDSKTLEKIVD